MALVAISVAALITAGCGGSSRTKSAGTTASKSCRASIGIEAPTSGQMASLGKEQLVFAKIAVAHDNTTNRTHISLVAGDTQLSGAATATQQMIANAGVVAVVGPAGGQEVETAGPLFARAGMSFISGSATTTSLTNGANPTFFRVVAKDSLQGPGDAHFVLSELHPKALMIIDDRKPYSTALVTAMIPIFRAAGVTVLHASVGQKANDFSALVGKITPRMTVVVLPWQATADAQQFGRTMVAEHRHATIVGTDRLYSPGSFTVPGSYVSAFGPDITAIPADRWLVQQGKATLTKFGILGAPAYAATHVVDEAIARVCRSGQTPTRSTVLPAIRATDEATSVLGQPIRFDAHGDLMGARWFLFHINSAGKYRPLAAH